MAASPDVSIVMPVFNAEQWVAGGLATALAQTHASLEVICVDDASTDRSVDIVRCLQVQDPRVRLLHQPRNLSPFQARGRAITVARAPFTLFLDADDELESEAVESVLRAARSAEADVVGFGVSVLDPAGETLGGYQTRLQPPHEELRGEEILRSFFSVEKPAQGQLWRYLFRTELLRASYAALPQGVELYRAEDLPITFLSLAAAERYTYVAENLYRYHFRRGGSGQTIAELSQFTYYAGALRSVDALSTAMESFTEKRQDKDVISALFSSIRTSILANVLGYVKDIEDPRLLHECIAALTADASHDELRAATETVPGTYELLTRHGYIVHTD